MIHDPAAFLRGSSPAVQRASVLVVVAAALALLTGCEKSACEMGHPVKVAPPWEGRTDLAPASAKVCGVDDEEPAMLLVAFPKDENPWVTVVKHLEDDKGWSRRAQDVSTKTMLTATLKKGDEELYVVVSKSRGYQARGQLTLSSIACKTSLATDGSACRKNQIVTCKRGGVVSEGATCKPTEECVTTKVGGATADSASCRPK